MCQSDCTWDHIMILEKRGLSDVVLECECNLSCQWVTLKWPDRMCLHSTWERVMILEHQTLSWVTVDSLTKDAIRYITCYLSACVPPNELEYCDRYLERRNESLRFWELQVSFHVFLWCVWAAQTWHLYLTRVCMVEDGAWRACIGIYCGHEKEHEWALNNCSADPSFLWRWFSSIRLSSVLYIHF